MRLLFILFVVALLIGLTLLRYRKGIMAVIRLSRELKQASLQATKPSIERTKINEPSPLVKCSRCGTWVPENRARKIGSSVFFCSSECIEAKVK